MFSVPPIITNVGKTLLLRAAGGEQITFTKFQAGKGFWPTGTDPQTVTALKSVAIANIPITKVLDTEEDGYVQLEGHFDNQTSVQADFLWTELGLIAEDEDGVEYLYAYGYDPENAEVIKAGSSAVMLEQNLSAIIAIGDSENITVNVLPNATYASRQEFLEHLADTDNPHQLTPQSIGAAPAEHTHSAADIVSGTLPISLGGTGVTTLADLKALIGGEYLIGFFTGDGTRRKDVTLGFKPDWVFLFPTSIGTRQDQCYYVWSFGPGHNYYHAGCPDSCATEDADTLFNRGHGGAAVTDTGFAVGRYAPSSEASSNTRYINFSNAQYGFIAGKINSFDE